MEAVDILEEIGVEAYKIPSGEVTNYPYIEYIAKTKKPIILSTGMTTFEEVDEAIKTIKKYHDKIVIMQCTSEYPCLPESVGINIIKVLENRYNLEVGFSDHTEDNWASIIAVYEGAKYIERHFTVSRKMYGPDAYMSLEPQDLEALVKGIKFVEKMKDSPVKKEKIDKFSDMRKTFQKSVVSVGDIKAGEIITEDKIGLKKPGTGLEPKYYYEIIGKKAKQNIVKDRVILKEDIEW
jgi:sialic acid synthase SpsE